MTAYKRGDILLVKFPMPDIQQYKPRPALVIQNNDNNQKLTHTIFLQITSNISNKGLPSQYFIDLNTAEGKLSGLLTDSVVKAEVIFTLPREFLYKKLGCLLPSGLEQIEKCIKYSLDLK